jgi:hypothetical protein
MFGGGTRSAYYNDVWELRFAGSGDYYWHKVNTSGTPPPGRSTHMAIYDPVGQRMVAYGGRTEHSAYGDVWALNLSDNSWQQLSPSGTPPGARCLAGAAYCPARHSMVFFGGTNLSTQFNDVWELRLDSLRWQQISPTGTPPSARESHGVFMDSNRLIVFAGMSAGVFLNDMWALDLTPGSEHWTQLSQSGNVPQTRATFGACCDPQTRRYFLFGGFLYPPSTLFNDLYVCDMTTTTWTRLTASGDVPAERRSSAALLGPLDNLVVFGGEGSDGFLGDLHYVNVANLEVREWQPVEPNLRSPSLFIPSVSGKPVNVSYVVPKPGPVTIRMIDLSGRVVRTLFAGAASAGSGSAAWDGLDDAGKPVAAGSYFCYLQTGQDGLSRKFVLTE